MSVMISSCLLAAILLAGCTEIKALKALQVENISPSSVKDGTYEGDQDNKIVTAKVSVTVKDGRIVDVKLLAHTHGPNHGAEAIVGKVLERQSLMVDAVSGSTYSSKVILKAIESALKKGM